ncbi:amino acid ABC transporter permease [Streptomyces sp. CBMA29]|uniref:amino acid ABC transporter permease n=1 Tax=Streptomyces sp. CBMA29 TaxID=1896314 RepID=UPI001661C5F0|nr:amino acid ABC transporter permease [Streptomyces sp. CBMA29]MBD0734745.1 ABC transporter permease [Streptomyces sp. CBMA29]
MTAPAAARVASAEDVVLSADEVAGLPVRRPARPLRWVTAALVLLLLAVAADTLVENGNFAWSVVGHYLFDSSILRGLVTTLWLTALSMVIGIVLGAVLALMRMSANPFTSGVSHLYIWFFRGTPVLVQLVFWYNLAALFPELSIGVPFGGPVFASGSSTALITPYSAALLGLGLNEAAYMAEIVRAGVRSVDEGQLEAARALAMSAAQTHRKILLPQAMRVIIPPTGNEFIGMLKTTSLVSVISLSDLLYSAQSIYAHNFQTIPLLIVVSLWYLLFTSVLSVAQSFLERRFDRAQSVRPRSPWPKRQRSRPLSTKARETEELPDER